MRNDLIAHGSLWKDHKYVGKIKLPSGKFLYFYDAKTYQNYLSRQSKNLQGQMAKKDPEEETKKLISNTASVKPEDVLKKSTGTTTGATIQQKTQEMNNNIAKGDAIVKGLLAGNYIQKTDTTEQKATEEPKKEESKVTTTEQSSSKSSSKKSGSSSKSGSSASKKGSSSGSKGSKSSSGSSKKNSSSSKGSSSSSTKSKTEETEKKETTNKRAKTLEDGLKKMLGVDDKQVNEHKTAKDFMKHLKSYKEGAHGYATVGGKTYRWTKKNGKITLVDIDTDKEVSIGSLKGSIREFQAKANKTIKRR